MDRGVENIMEGDVGRSQLRRNRGDTTDGHVGRSPVDRGVENIMEGDVGTSMMKSNGPPRMDGEVEDIMDTLGTSWMRRYVMDGWV